MAICNLCGGKGGRRGPYGWIKCECRKMTDAKRRAQVMMSAPLEYTQEQLDIEIEKRKACHTSLRS